MSPEERSKRMSLVKNKDSRAELAVRSLVHRLGYRFRLHDASLPGKPDLVFKSRRKVIFVHGCFWHRHEGCPRNRTPKSRLEFWVPKLEKNRKRDEEVRRLLSELGWSILVVWECEAEDEKALESTIRGFLG